MPQPSALASLKLRDRRFVEEYVIDFNGTKAGLRAGFARRSARQQASVLLSKHNIQVAIAEKVQKQSEKLELTAERVLLEIARISYADKRKLFDRHGRLLKPHQWDDDTAAAVAGIDLENKKVRMHPKNEALNLAGRYLKLFKDDLPVPPTGGNYVLIAPATATPEEWMKLVQQHARAGQ